MFMYGSREIRRVLPQELLIHFFACLESFKRPEASNYNYNHNMYLWELHEQLMQTKPWRGISDQWLLQLISKLDDYDVWVTQPNMVRPVESL